MDWKLYTDKYNNRFEHFLSVQIVPVFVQVQKPSLSRGKGLYKAPESSARMALLEPLDSEIAAVDIRQVWYRQVQVRICTVVWPAPPLYRIH